MNRKSIKVIKRKDLGVSADAETQTTSEPEASSALSEVKIERNLQRKIADTVSNCITERRKNKRAEEISAIQRMFGSESLFGKTA